MTGESRAQRLVSHPRNSSWQLFSLLWSVWTPYGPREETHDEKVPKEANRRRTTESLEKRQIVWIRLNKSRHSKKENQSEVFL